MDSLSLYQQEVNIITLTRSLLWVGFTLRNALYAV